MKMCCDFYIWLHASWQLKAGAHNYATKLQNVNADSVVDCMALIQNMKSTDQQKPSIQLSATSNCYKL